MSGNFKRVFSEERVRYAEEQVNRAMDAYVFLVAKPPANVAKRLEKWRWITETLIKGYNEQGRALAAFMAALRELQGAEAEHNNKRWSKEEDDLVVEWRCQDFTIQRIAISLGRSPASIATRLTYLVGIKRLFINVDGKIVGSLDGDEVDGHFKGILEKEQLT